MCTRCLLLHAIYILGIIRLTRFPFSAFPWSHSVLGAEHRTAYIIHMPHICHRILECNLFPLFTCNSKFNFIDAAVSFSIFSYHASRSHFAPSLSLYLSCCPFLSALLSRSPCCVNQWRTDRTCSYICVCVALVIYDCDYGLTIVILQWQIKFHKIYWIKCASDRVSWRMVMQKLEMNTTFTRCMCVCVRTMFAHRLRFISIKFWIGLF